MSNKLKVIPVKMCGKEMIIKANLVENNVPLLISNQSLKNAKAKVSFIHDTLLINGKMQQLITTSFGHYGIPVRHYNTELMNAMKMMESNCPI